MHKHFLVLRVSQPILCRSILPVRICLRNKQLDEKVEESLVRNKNSNAWLSRRRQLWYQLFLEVVPQSAGTLFDVWFFLFLPAMLEVPATCGVEVGELDVLELWCACLDFTHNSSRWMAWRGSCILKRSTMDIQGQAKCFGKWLRCLVRPSHRRR